MGRVVLHTEASLGFGGQEIRILKESIGMRARGIEVILAASPGALLIDAMKKEGFTTYSLSFEKKNLFSCLFQLNRIIKKHHVSLINTHSSLDAWLAGLAARLFGIAIVRTRHLSTPIKPGLNSYLLYNKLTDVVVTTCEEIVPLICSQAKISKERCLCIPTGVDPSQIQIDPNEVKKFRTSLGVKEEDIVVGTLCVLRSWKGISDLLKAASQLRGYPNLKWVIIGSGPSEDRFKNELKELGLKNVIFTGHIDPPFTAIAALDIFMLVSTSNEGISQATLQAGFLSKPLVTTLTGGLKEVCIDGKTGITVPKNAPEEIAKAVKRLIEDKAMQREFGKNAHALIVEKFTLKRTLDEMMKVYDRVLGAK